MSITPEEISIRVGLDAKPAQKGLKNIEKTLKGFGKIGKANNKIFSDFLRLAGFAGLTKMTVDAGNFAHSMHILSQQTGIAVDKLSKMRNVWVGLGADKKSLATFTQRMSSDLAGFFTGAGSNFYSAFARMGISPFDKGGNIRDVKELLGDVADYMSMQNVPEWVKVGTLGNLFGMPAEIAQHLVKGREEWYKIIEEEEQNVSGITEEEANKLERAKNKFREVLVNAETAWQKTMARLSDFFTGVLDPISKFSKENPLMTGAIEGATALYGVPKLLKGGSSFLHWLLGGKGTAVAGGTVGALSGAGGMTTLPAFLALLGLVGTISEISGYNLIGQKTKAPQYDMWADFLNTFKGTGWQGDRSYQFYAKMLKDWYESGFVTNEELAELLKSGRYGGAYTQSVLRDITKTSPEVFRSDGSGYSWQNFWQYMDTTKAIRGGSFIDSHNTINQENHFIINDMTADDAKQFGEQAATEIYHPLVWKAMTGVG